MGNSTGQNKAVKKRRNSVELNGIPINGVERIETTRKPFHKAETKITSNMNPSGDLEEHFRIMADVKLKLAGENFDGVLTYYMVNANRGFAITVQHEEE